MPPSTEFITVLENKRAKLERVFQHRFYADSGINSRTARKSRVDATGVHYGKIIHTVNEYTVKMRILIDKTQVQ